MSGPLYPCIPSFQSGFGPQNQKMQIIEWNVANKIILNAALAGLSTDIWTPPPGNCSKLDFDGSYKIFTQSAGFGSIIRTSA